MNHRGNAVLKIVDRFAGIPLVRVLGATPRRRRPTAMGKIGLLRTAAIGDTLLLSGPIDDLRAASAGSEIVLVTGSDNAEAGALVAAGRARHVTIDVRRPIDAVARLRRERFDVLIDTGSWPRLDATLTALSGAAFRIGFRTAGQHRHFAYDAVADHSATVHELENHRALVRVLGLRAAAPPGISPSALSPLPSAIRPERPFICFHPWSGGYRGDLKEWPADRWIALAQRLGDVAGTFVITGSMANTKGSLEIADRMTAVGLRAVSVAGEIGLGQLGALLLQGIGLVSVNTGVMHLGAILGVPTIALDGPTPPRRWGPIGARATSVAPATDGCGFINLGFEYAGHRSDCMRAITVDDVERAVRQMVGRSR